jgi:hypothetical protein
VMRPGPMISASFGQSGCLIGSDEGRIFISKISADLPEQLAIKQEKAANVPICPGVIIRVSVYYSARESSALKSRRGANPEGVAEIRDG